MEGGAGAGGGERRAGWRWGKEWGQFDAVEVPQQGAGAARARRGRRTWMTPISPKLPVRFSLGCVSAKYARKSAIWKPEPVMTRAASLRGMGDAAVTPAWRWACGWAPELWAAQNCGPATTEARQESHCFGPASAHLDERVREAQEGAAGRRDQQRDEDHGPSADLVRQRTQQRRQHGLAGRGALRAQLHQAPDL